MKRNRRFVILLTSLGALIVIGGIVSIGVLTSPEETKHLVEACKQIQIGMTREEVLQIMGSPLTTVSFERDGEQKDQLIFPSKPLASTPPQCVIDNNTGQVEEVTCDEDYRLKAARVL